MKDQFQCFPFLLQDRIYAILVYRNKILFSSSHMKKDKKNLHISARKAPAIEQTPNAMQVQSRCAKAANAVDFASSPS